MIGKTITFLTIYAFCAVVLFGCLYSGSRLLYQMWKQGDRTNKAFAAFLGTFTLALLTGFGFMLLGI